MNEKPTSHIPRGADTSEQHIRRDLAAKIAYEQNRNAGIILGTFEVQVLCKSIEFAVNHRVSI